MRCRQGIRNSAAHISTLLVRHWTHLHREVGEALPHRQGLVVPVHSADTEGEVAWDGQEQGHHCNKTFCLCFVDTRLNSRPAHSDSPNPASSTFLHLARVQTRTEVAGNLIIRNLASEKTLILFCGRIQNTWANSTKTAYLTVT